MLPPRPPPRPLDAHGLPAASRLERRAALAVAAVATAWFTLAAAWEMFGPLLAGHYASSASVGIIAENMLRWKILGPVWEYTAARPTPDMYYCHHPWGIFWTTAAFLEIFGRHDVICRLPAVLLSAATPPLLYAIGRSVYRPAAGAAAAAAFVVLPITLSFANFNALEVPVMAWTLLGLWGYVRLTQTSRRRYLAASVLGLALGMNADWPAFVLTGGLLAFVALRAWVLPRRAFGPGPTDGRTAALWWALTALAAALTVALYAFLFHRSGKLDDLLASYRFRSSGNVEPLRQVLASRRYWIELSFTPIAVAAGKLAAIVCAARLALLRREHDVLPLIYLATATVQYVVFRQGADIHIFWPHYFGAYFALAAAALVESGAALLERAAARRGLLAGPLPAAWPALAALGLWLVPLAAILRDGIPALRYARETGGRFNERGHLIHSDGAKTAFLRWLAPRLAAGARVEMHEGMKATWAQVWALGGRVVAPVRPAPRGEPPRGAYLADTRFMPDREQASLARRFDVTAVGPFWAIGAGLGAKPAATPERGIEAFSFREREPGPFAWYFISGTEPEREIVPDPFLTWELRTHFGQPAEPPGAAPETLNQKRIAHNIALAAGDSARAAALRAAIDAALTPLGVRFDDGTELVGTTFQDGARPLLTIVVRAGGPLPADVALVVRSRVVERAPLSTTMADPLVREVGLPTAIAPQRWRAGFLYADPVPIRKRPGTEVFWASLSGRAPKLTGRGGAQQVEVLRLR
ncbi:glycosyltransferase [Sorangium cellulosum]|uniref:Glycosyltransferase n=1 Tax=Sorangium cellulosum TaxID=56 RepID=A0A2L0F4A9_SORCE|nr:glycosyltransferase family 39 protein [Sorangium cellulosum]AUX46341.1 glycosyltransferase [Sorangium cellulosum]